MANPGNLWVARFRQVSDPWIRAVFPDHPGAGACGRDDPRGLDAGGGPKRPAVPGSAPPQTPWCGCRRWTGGMVVADELARLPGCADDPTTAGGPPGGRLPGHGDGAGESPGPRSVEDSASLHGRRTGRALVAPAAERPGSLDQAQAI